MTVHHSIHIRVLFQYLRMDVALRIASYRAIHWRPVRDEIFADIGQTSDGGRTLLQRDEEGRVVVRISQADVAHGVEDIVVVEDVVCGYEGGDVGG